MFTFLVSRMSKLLNLTLALLGQSQLCKIHIVPVKLLFRAKNRTHPVHDVVCHDRIMNETPSLSHQLLIIAEFVLIILSIQIILTYSIGEGTSANTSWTGQVLYLSFKLQKVNLDLQRREFYNHIVPHSKRGKPTLSHMVKPGP